MGCLHCGHELYDVASVFQFARRFAVRVLLCFFLGTAMVVPFVSIDVREFGQ